MSFRRLIFSWTASLLRRRPTILVGTMIGVGLALALIGLSRIIHRFERKNDDQSCRCRSAD